MKHGCLLLLSAAAMLPAVSCQLIDRVFNGDVIARVGGDVLYEYQVTELLPEECSSEDSARIVGQFIDSWATQRLVLGQAEKNLSKDDRNIGKELEELRRDLLAYRYEMKYVDTHLDTVIADSECEAYYKANSQSFTASTPIVRCRYVKIHSSSPNLALVEKLCRSDVQEDLNDLDDICYSSAEKYLRYDDRWISLDAIALELGQALSFCEEELARTDFMNIRKGGYEYLLYVTAKIPTGDVMPYDFCQNHIKEIILGRRKQELVAALERNLLADAKSSGFLTVYKKGDE